MDVQVLVIPVMDVAVMVVMLWIQESHGEGRDMGIEFCPATIPNLATVNYLMLYP